MFDFSCKGCPAHDRAVAFVRCVEEGPCWTGDGRHPVEEVLHQMGLDAYDVVAPRVIEIRDGELVQNPLQLNQRGRIVFDLAHVLAMQKRKARLQELGFDKS